RRRDTVSMEMAEPEPRSDSNEDAGAPERRGRRSGGGRLLGSHRAIEAAEVLLIVALFVAPLAIGSVRPWAIAMVVARAAAAALAAAIGHPRAVPWPVWAAAAAAAVVGLQAVPLPAGLLRVLSPRAVEILELATPGARFEGMHSIALDPAAAARE